jgi:putative membrane protein
LVSYGVASAACAGAVAIVLLGSDLDAEAVLRSVRAIDWWLVPVAAYHLVPLLLSAGAWQRTLAPLQRRPLAALLALRWIREGVSGLLPVAQIGGDAVGARLLAGPAVPASAAVASVIVDLAIEAATLGVFVVLGLALLADTGSWTIALSGSTPAVAVALVAGVLVSATAWRLGLDRPLRRLAASLLRRWKEIGPAFARDIADAVAARCADRRAMAAAVALHLLSWLAAAAEIWLVLLCIGVPIGVRAALVIESLSHALRGAAFFVPAGLGVQEAALVELGGLFGIAPEAALALALARRLREVALGVPALLAWQALELRRLSRSAAHRP